MKCPGYIDAPDQSGFEPVRCLNLSDDCWRFCCHIVPQAGNVERAVEGRVMGIRA
jgi:hypothetical protein